ncbi:MAG TPA: acyltransferase [Spirochaetia bacterium]|nr:acyltransferase [Spirochaetia bacterium]
MQTMSVPSVSAGAGPARIFYLDTLKIFLTILVIAHHVGQAYGPTGGYWPVQETARAALLAPFFTVNRSFFMSLFFMVSGYFMVSAYRRNGFGAFIRSRFVRLGIPVLAFALLMLPSRLFVFGDHITRWDDYFNAGHLWYLEHVLLFSVVYAVWQKIRESSRGATQRPTRASTRKGPGLLAICTAMLVVAVATAAVRIWSPIDRWMNLLGFFRIAFADVPRDLSFFIFGAMAFTRGWFESFPTGRGLRWLAIGAAAAIAWYAWALIPHSGITLSGRAFGIVYPIWEELLCFGMCIGLLVLFRQTASYQGRFARFLAANQYSAYFWHPMLIVGIQMGFLALPLGPFVKFAAVTALGVPVVFLWSWLVRRIPAVRSVL